MGSKQRVLLVAGGQEEIIKNYIQRKFEIINKVSLTLLELENFFGCTQEIIDGVIVTDDAFSVISEDNQRNIVNSLQWLESNQKQSVLMLVLTHDSYKEKELGDLIKSYKNLHLIQCDFIRLTSSFIMQSCEELLVKQKTKIEKNKKSFFERFKKKENNNASPQVLEASDKRFDNISRGMSKVIAITGHRGAGLTSTTINVAYEASKRGLSSIIIDMDIEYRSMNMYFNSFHEMTKRDIEMNASLIRTLARPQEFMTTAFNLKDDLWLSSLGYDFSDQKLLDTFYNNTKFISLLSVLRQRFNLVIIDMPMELLKQFNEAIVHIDLFGLCVSNNLYSVLNTLRSVEGTLKGENRAYLNAKTKAIITQYNDRSRFQNNIFIPEKVSEVLTSGLLEGFEYDMKIAGYISYSQEFDRQIEADLPIVNLSAEHEKAYGNILLRLMEGV